MTFPPDLYRAWRERGGALTAFREARKTGPPPERWLQEIWAHQRLKRNELQTTDGRRVSILHPGFWNRESGPDFLGAVIQFGDSAPLSGDVEIDLVASGWKSHGHAGNAAYRDVVLHVVWDAPAGPAVLPTLSLQPHLDSPLEELEVWVGGAGEMPTNWLRGHCSAPLGTLSHDLFAGLLEQAALVRLQTKALQLRARARSAGWHQALWEGVFRALGYKHNAWPMQRLAELIPILREHAVEGPEIREGWEARLLGLSGLLPSEPRPGSHARRLWDRWWRERAALGDHALPATLWRLHGVRPVNHPQRRLAIAAAWLADDTWAERMESWFASALRGSEAMRALEAVLRPSEQGFWRRHYTLTSRQVPEGLPMIGSGRVTDIAVNVILPWFWARAEVGGEEATRQYVQDLYLSWPAGEDNSILKLARGRLFGAGDFPVRRTASAQQALLQIARDFCGYSNSLCEHCPFPALVEALASPVTREGRV